jgi:hypothetical protein
MRAPGVLAIRDLNLIRSDWPKASKLMSPLRGRW